jgi:hypothetical protein
VNGLDAQSRGRWLKKTQLTDSKKSVNDVKFAPRHLGLKLASASGDGMVRIYEANDVFSLNYWPMQVYKNHYHNCCVSSKNQIIIYLGFFSRRNDI